MGVKCPKCQHENPEELSFCGKCGTQLPSPEKAEVTETLETPKEELTTGSTFAERYQIIEELGKGGMGRVYRVLDKELKEEVALKLIRPEISKDKKTIERFKNELKVARRISHRNVGRMYELMEDRGTHFITMEYVSGQDFKGLMRQTGQLTVGKSISIAKQICDGLAEAHSLGVVHRDLKPSNIMIDRGGNAKIMDFGIARAVKGKSITGAGVIIGTPQYMSPEQVEGKDIDQRTDIYSLGIILYEMLTDRVPFEGDTPLTVGVKQKTEVPKDPKDFNERIPEDLNHLILKCLEKERDNRYQRAEELFTDLEAIEKGIPTTERTAPSNKTTTSKEVTVTFQRRWVWLVVLCMVVAASVLTFFILKGGKDIVPQKKGKLIVLPFDNEGLPEDDYFVNGITREITDRLSYLEELDVIARTSAIQAKISGKSIGQMRDELHVDYVVSGAVQRDKRTEKNERVFVSAELVNASDLTQLWSGNFERSLDDIVSVQTQIAEEVVRELDLTLLEPVREAIRAKPTENMKAYDLYLRASDQWDRAMASVDPQEFEKAIKMYEEVIDLDPSFVDAWLDISSTHTVIYYFGWDMTDGRLEKSRAALEKADEIRPDYIWTNYQWAYYYLMGLQDLERAEELYESVRKVRPNVSMSLISRIYSAQGKFEEAVAATKIQAERDPLNPLYLNEIGIILMQMRRYEEAETWYNRAASMEQGRMGNLFNRFFNAYKWKGYSAARDLLDGWPDGDFKKWGLISFETFAGRNCQEALDSLDSLQTDTFEVLSTYLEKNLSYALVYRLLDKPALKISHAESARQRLEDLVRKFPKDPKYRSALGLAYALLGQKEEAIREGKTAVEQYPVSKDALWGTSYINILVDILIICEEYEEAIDHLEYLMSIPAGRNVSTVYLQTASFYDPLRDHPRFKRLLEKYSE